MIQFSCCQIDTVAGSAVAWVPYDKTVCTLNLPGQGSGGSVRFAIFLFAVALTPNRFR